MPVMTTEFDILLQMFFGIFFQNDQWNHVTYHTNSSVKFDMAFVTYGNSDVPTIIIMKCFNFPWGRRASA